jgi:hypothetical protein
MFAFLKFVKFIVAVVSVVLAVVVEFRKATEQHFAEI